MQRRFYASHQVAGPNRTNKNLWFSTAPEAERACDELWTLECRQEIVDTESGVFRVRGADGSWSPWGARHPEGGAVPGVRRHGLG
jgi:hypothetical protein